MNSKQAKRLRRRARELASSLPEITFDSRGVPSHVQLTTRMAPRRVLTKDGVKVQNVPCTRLSYKRDKCGRGIYLALKAQESAGRN